MRASLSLCCLLCACQVRGLDWYYEVDPAVTPAGIEVEIRSGACDGEIVHEQSFAAGSAAAMPPSLGTGDHSFVVRALDASCNVVAEGCTTVELPLSQDSLTVDVSMTAPRPGCEAGESCEAGVCVSRETGDAGMCGSGCFDGTQCVEGNTLEACGNSGGVCEVCGCTNDTCVDGRCVPAHPVSNVTAGANHTCAITAEGVLYCWGGNGVGQLGDRCCNGREMPMASDGRSDWTFVESMNFSVCGLRGGALECWGSNNYNQLGRGAGSDENSDEILPAMGPAAWSRVSTGIWHTVGIDDTGALYCWGSAVHSTCAMAGIEELDVPTRIGTESTWDEVCGGFYQTCGIRDGTLLCWGWNRDGETGTGGKGGAISSMTRVDDASDWAEVTCGFGHTCARREDGRVFCFGCDGTECYSGAETECGGDCTGKLGTGVPASSGIPLEISGGLLARSIDAGTHTCAVGMDSSLWCWGPNPSGVLGVGDVLMRDVPTELPLRGWIDVSAGRRHTCAIREGGQLYCWGSNEDRQLGDEASLDGELSPARVCIR